MRAANARGAERRLSEASRAKDGTATAQVLRAGAITAACFARASDRASAVQAPLGARRGVALRNLGLGVKISGWFR
jgi:hypothetical protein